MTPTHDLPVVRNVQDEAGIRSPMGMGAMMPR
jgi:hypothetical protein